MTEDKLYYVEIDGLVFVFESTGQYSLTKVELDIRLAQEVTGVEIEKDKLINFLLKRGFVLKSVSKLTAFQEEAYKEKARAIQEAEEKAKEAATEAKIKELEVEAEKLFGNDRGWRTYTIECNQDNFAEAVSQVLETISKYK